MEDKNPHSCRAGAAATRACDQQCRSSTLSLIRASSTQVQLSGLANRRQYRPFALKMREEHRISAFGTIVKPLGGFRSLLIERYPLEFSYPGIARNRVGFENNRTFHIPTLSLFSANTLIRRDQACWQSRPLQESSLIQ